MCFYFESQSPVFLSMAASLSVCEWASTAGELQIFDFFFSQRKRQFKSKMCVYQQIKRLFVIRLVHARITMKHQVRIYGKEFNMASGSLEETC